MGKQSPVRILYKVSLGLQPYRMMKWNMSISEEVLQYYKDPTSFHIFSSFHIFIFFMSSYSLYFHVLLPFLKYCKDND